MFLPINRKEMEERGWDSPDFVFVSGDAYVDHSSFAVAIISRYLEKHGFKIAILAQPDWKNADSFKEFGQPRLGFLIASGNMDSMVAHYTVAKKKRNYDYYSPGGKIGKRPDRATIVYSNKIREAFGDIPIIIGGVEASLRRFAHYDYWDNKVRNSILIDSGADILIYGMGEKAALEIAKLLDRGVPVKKIKNIRGTCVLCQRDYIPKGSYDFIGEIEELKTSKELYAQAFATQYINCDSISGKTLLEGNGNRLLVQNPPMPPLERKELDLVYELDYMRDYHPIYKKEGGVPAIQEVKFSITHNRGCFGACSFCAIAFHQGRAVRSRSIESCVKEAKLLTELPDFKGYIHDVGGPTANFRHPACDKQLTDGVCANKRCLSPTPCKNLKIDHSEYIELLKRIENVPKVKKVFIRSGIRFDYVMYDKDDGFMKKLVKDHVSGQLRVAPEHNSKNVLEIMGKPDISIYNGFCNKFYKLSREIGKEQYVLPYLMSSHPGSTMEDAHNLSDYIKEHNLPSEQVQDFYPTPSTKSTCIYYTGIDPFTKKKIYTATNYKEKQEQRKLLQPSKPPKKTFVSKKKK
ncbi:MAG: YgiQ family radical SAM protein [Ruminococcaceae bacterium]|nr:YgiQ family radical SAM protein [Oscillospiraceae bacterium]